MEETNRLIAEFMGFGLVREITRYNYGMDFTGSYDKETIYCNSEPYLKVYESKFGSHTLETYTNYFDSFDQKEEFKYKSFLSYNSNWNELMKVVERIESLDYPTQHGNVVKIFKTFVEIKDLWKGQIIVLPQPGMKTKIEAVYKAVVEFIQWYNQNK